MKIDYRETTNDLLKRIDKRVKKNPITEKEIAEEIAAYRKEKYAQGRS